VNEVPRRQFTGGCCPREIVAEIEDGVAEVFEDEVVGGVELGLEIESGEPDACRSIRLPDPSILQFFFMAAPKFSATSEGNRGAKITNGPVHENK
jgi:hypothetical protein